jgi:hypothetical protein
VGPQPQPAVGRLVQQPLHQRSPVAVSPLPGMDHELRAGALDLVGDVEMRVRHEDAALGLQQQVAYRLVPAVPQVQHHVLGQWPDPVRLGGRVDQLHDARHIAGRETAANTDEGR